MPYPFTHHAAALVLVAVIIGFWPSYFGQLGEAPLAFHVHGLVASAWLLLVGFQSWTIHNGRRGLHRWFGRTSLVLFPLLIMSLVMIADLSASIFASGDSYYAVVGTTFGLATWVALLAYLVLITLALRHRRNVRLHGGFMVASLFFLWEPAASRLLVEYAGPFAIEGPADFGKVKHVIALSSAMVVPVGLYLYAKNRAHGLPFLIGTGFLLAQIAAIYWIADLGVFRDFFAAYAQWGPGITAGAGLVVGAAAAWIGWQYPKAPTRPTPSEEAPLRPGMRRPPTGAP